MAVEARHVISLSHPQIVNSRDLMIMNGLEGSNGNLYGGYGLLAPPLSATTASVVPVYGSVVTADVVKATAAINKSGSGLTCAAVPVSRTRPRDAINPPVMMTANDCSFTFLGEDMSLHLQRQQLEIDRFIVQQAEKVRVEIEERRKRHCRRIAAAVEETISKRLRAKEEEIENIGGLNFALEERVKSLCVENEIWRELAQTNEATANALRFNLEQVLQQPQALEGQHRGDDGEDDAQSCCGSNFNNETDRGDRSNNNINGGGTSRNSCRSCGKEESCVLVLPCRHLCLCTACGSSRRTCPVCCSVKTASLHVNLS